MLKQYLSKSIKETNEIACQLSKEIREGDIIGLSGDLGSGKTSFTQGLAKALGVKDYITSPTFVIMKIYSLKNKKYQKIKRIIHIDAYRLSTNAEIEALGIQDFFNQKGNLIIVEWPENIIKFLPKQIKIIKFSSEGEDKKKIFFKNF